MLRLVLYIFQIKFDRGMFRRDSNDTLVLIIPFSLLYMGSLWNTGHHYTLQEAHLSHSHFLDSTDYHKGFVSLLGQGSAKCQK